MNYRLFIFCLYAVFFQTKNEKIDSNHLNDFPFWNENLPLEKRLDDLMERLTLQEMVDQMINGGGNPDIPAPEIKRLGIPPYNFDTECLRGIASLNSTAFPMPLNLAATFSGDLAFQMASAVSTEARGIFNDASDKKDYGDMKGLNCFAPFVNMARHPLWGRTQETFGEDPLLIGTMAENYVKGLQGTYSGKLQSTINSNPLKGRYLRTIAGCKHFIAHSGPDNIPTSRFSFDSKVTLRDFILSYLPAFQQCIKAGAFNVMCSYNSLNGVPTCASTPLLADLLRKEMAFEGFVVSDMGAIENIFTGHNFTYDLKEAGIMAASAGVDLNLHGSSENAFNYLKEAVEEGMLPYSKIVAAARRLFKARFLLGLFDPPSLNPYSNIKKDQVLQSPYHRALALEVAVKSIVMLKNLRHTLPVKSFGRLSMIGPMCNNLEGQMGGYAPNILPQYSSTPYQALKEYSNKIVLESGCDDNKCNKYNQSSVVQATKNSDFIVVCLGTGESIEGEEKDRESLKLPGHQEQLLSDVISHAMAPIVLIVFSGCPVDLTRAKLSPKVLSILHSFYPGQAGGEALRKIMVLSERKGSDHMTDGGAYEVVSPSGRLPFTWPESLDQLPPITDYSMVNRTYRYSTAQPLYPFGYGLSYSSFLYSNLSLTPSVIPCNEVERSNHVKKCSVNDEDFVKISVFVTNTGDYDAEEVVQAYITWKGLPVNITMPKLQMVAFQRVILPSGPQGTNVILTVKTSQFKVLDNNHQFVYLPGRIEFFVGGQQPHTSTKSDSNVLNTTITILF